MPSYSLQSMSLSFSFSFLNYILLALVHPLIIRHATFFWTIDVYSSRIIILFYILTFSLCWWILDVLRCTCTGWVCWSFFCKLRVAILLCSFCSGMYVPVLQTIAPWSFCICFVISVPFNPHFCLLFCSQHLTTSLVPTCIGYFLLTAFLLLSFW